MACPGRRKIARNWERDPVTGEKRYLPDLPSSPSDTNTNSEDSSCYIMLKITDVVSNPNQAYFSTEKTWSVTRTSRDEQSRISQTPTLEQSNSDSNEAGSVCSTFAESIREFKVVE